MQRHFAWIALKALLLAVLLGGVASLEAQVTTASISGTATDQTGALITGATVTATNTSTGIFATQKTNSKGYFVFTNLHIGGPYSITVEQSGFQRFTATGIVLDLSSAREVNATLKIGASTQNISVRTDAVQVETVDVQLKHVLSAEQLQELPTLGRDVVQLQKTAPGVMESSDREGTFSTNGSQTQENSFLVDGADINDTLLNQPGIVINPDALAEVNIISSTLDPEFSRNSGAIIDEALKSGTNVLHGNGFEFYRDTFLNNGNYFSATRPVFHQNVFGATLGGPILHNRAFFFAAYQGQRSHTAQTQLTHVFTKDQRGGDFSADGAFSSNPIPFASGLKGSNGFCPAGTTWKSCFPDGKIPVTDFDSIASKLLNRYVPEANYTSGGIPYDNFNAMNTADDDQGIVRIDTQLTPNNQLWASTIFDSSPRMNTLPLPSTQSTGTGANLPGFAANNSSHAKIFNASWTHVFSSSALNELRAGYFRYNYAELEPAASTLESPSSYGFNIEPQNSAAGALPLIIVNGYFNLGFSTNGPEPRKNENYNYVDNFSKVLGQHDLKFGAMVERMIYSSHMNFKNNGLFKFNSTAVYSTGNAAADFLLGIPASYRQSSGYFIDSRAWQYYAYAQDHWKVASRITLAYGLGYNTETPWENMQYDGVGVTCWYANNTQSKVFTSAPPGLLYPGDSGCNRNGGPTTHWNHVSPRVGFTWAPGGALGEHLGNSSQHAFVLRGGFGLYWNRTQGEGTQMNSYDAPFVQNSLGAAGKGGNPGFADPFHDIADTAGASYSSNPFPYSVPKAGKSADFSSLYPLEMDNLTSDYNVPYTYNFNLNVQKALPSNMVLTAGFVGSLGHRLIRAAEGDPITSAGHEACVNGTGTGASIVLSGKTYSCRQLASEQSLYFPGNKLQTATVSGMRIPGVFPNGEPDYLSIGGMHTSGTSNYSALQASLTKAPTHGLYFALAYTYSHALDNASSLEDSVANGYNINNFPGFQHLSYGDSSYDARHRFTATYNYEIPLMPGMRNDTALRAALAGWHLSGVTALQNGFPVTIYAGSTYNSLYCDQFSFISCPDVPNTSSFHIKTFNPRHQGNYWFNTSVFSDEPIGTFGNVKRNFFHGPGFNYSNFEVYKNIALGRSESSRYLQLRLEAYNAFNHANFANPSGNYGAGSSVFGVITSVDQPVNSGGDPQPARAIQIAGKIYF